MTRQEPVPAPDLIERATIRSAIGAALIVGESRETILALIDAAPAVPSLTVERLARVIRGLNIVPFEEAETVANLIFLRLATPEGTEP